MASWLRVQTLKTIAITCYMEAPPFNPHNISLNYTNFPAEILYDVICKFYPVQVQIIFELSKYIISHLGYKIHEQIISVKLRISLGISPSLCSRLLRKLTVLLCLN